MDKYDKIDRIIREKIGDYEAAPPDKVWAAIQARTPAQRSSKKPYYLVSAAAAILILLISGYFLLQGPDKPNPSGSQSGNIATNDTNKQPPAPGNLQEDLQQKEQNLAENSAGMEADRKEEAAIENAPAKNQKPSFRHRKKKSIQPDNKKSDLEKLEELRNLNKREFVLKGNHNLPRYERPKGKRPLFKMYRKDIQHVESKQFDNLNEMPDSNLDQPFEYEQMLVQSILPKQHQNQQMTNTQQEEPLLKELPKKVFASAMDLIREEPASEAEGPKKRFDLVQTLSQGANELLGMDTEYETTEDGDYKTTKLSADFKLFKIKRTKTTKKD